MTGFVTDSSVLSWGRVHCFVHRVARPSFCDQLPGLIAEARRAKLSLLPVGLRRSYGDSGLNDGGALIDMSRLDRLIAFDPATGRLEAEAGASLAAILAFVVPRGFFLPVVPGTKYVTLGGAVANDVHGKNHHHAGSFGRWVQELELIRTDGSAHCLHPGDGDGLFAATIGGLGLTGIITRVVVKLQPLRTAAISRRDIPFGSLAEYFALTREHVGRSTFTVSWTDCLTGGGIFTAADHVEADGLNVDAVREPGALPRPPTFALNSLSISAVNALRRGLGRFRTSPSRVPYGRFFFPLDAMHDWNRMYGKDGMRQYQSVVPPGAAEQATAAMLAEISRSGDMAFLAVLKSFGALASPGLLSFPREGTTLAMDFPNKGDATLALFERLDAIVREAGGRLYPAKDGRLGREMFRRGYPNLDRFADHVDPGLGSSFWRRVTG